MAEKIPMALKSNSIPRKPLPKIMIKRPQPTRPWKLDQIDQEKLQSYSIQPSKNPVVILDNWLNQSAKDQSKQESVNPSVQLPPKLRNKVQPSPEPVTDSPSSPNHQNDESLTDTVKYKIKIKPKFDDTEDRISANKTSEPVQADPNNRPASVNSHSSLLKSHLQKLPKGNPANDSQILIRQNPAARPPSRVQSQEHLRPVTPFLRPHRNVNPERNHNYDNAHVEMLMKSVLTPKFCSPNAIDLSAQQQIPAIRRKSSATITQPVEKKTRGNIQSTQQMYQQLNYARNVQNPGSPYQNMNNSAAQYLSNLAHQAHPFDPSQLQIFLRYAQACGIPISPEVPVNQRTYTRDPRAEYVQPLQQTQQPLDKNQIPAPRKGSAVQNQPAGNLHALLTHDQPKHQNQCIEKVQVTEKEPDTLTGFLKNHKEILRKLQFAKLSVSSIKVDEFPPEITQNSVLETTNKLEEMQSEVRSPEENVQQSEGEKLNDDRTMNVELIEDYGDEVTSQENGYETDRHQSKDLQAPVYEDEILEASTDDSYYAEDGIRSEEDAPAITEEESMDAQSLVSESSENLSKESALKMLEAHGLMLTKLYRSFLKTEDYYNYLRMTTLGCLRLYREMKKCVIEDDKESCPVPALKEKALEVVEEPAEEPIEEPTEEPIEEPAPEPSPAVTKIPNGKQKKSSDSKIKKPIKDDNKQKFVLPPEYDPKDSKWTLRYKGPGRGLMELIPHSGVYLRRVEYNKCIKNADSCRKLARTLIKAVFDKNALGVCSVTGAKARAFNGTGMVTRPGLDEEARMVFLKFVEDFGKGRGWDTSDTAGIISSIRTKMHGMRRKYEKKL